jgi:hypothetical protein
MTDYASPLDFNTFVLLTSVRLILVISPFGGLNGPVAETSRKIPLTDYIMHKKWLSTLACFILVVNVSMAQEGYRVVLKTPSYKSGLAYLTYHMGKNLNIQDSAIVSSLGVAEFKGTQNLPGGIYSIVFPGKNLSMDFLVDKSQDISIKVDTSNLAGAVITGSPENQLFKEYQAYIADKGRLLHLARTSYNNAKTKEDSVKFEAEYVRLNKELSDYREGVIKNHPESMMAALFNAMKEPPVLDKKLVTRQDTLDNYYYYKAHYWDGITFMDDRIVRTPFFLPKLERYYREIMPQSADSLKKDIDYKLLLARTAPEMYKFLLNWLTDEYINPKYMGLDAVFVHLFEKYHSKGLTSWLNEKQMETITKRAYMQMANLIGEKAANLEMTDSTGKQKNLYDVNADFLVVIFWDPNCGHCKEEVPRIDSAYHASWKSHGVKLYAVMIEPGQVPAWVKYTQEHKLNDWIHVYQTKEREKADTDAQRPSFRQLYDVTMTPTLYLLDKEKRIIGKKLSWKQLNDFMEVKWKEKEKKP